MSLRPANRLLPAVMTAIVLIPLSAAAGPTSDATTRAAASETADDSRAPASLSGVAVEGLPDLSQPPSHWPAAKKRVVHYHNGKLVEDNSAPTIEVISELQEPNPNKLMVPAFPGDLVYMSLQVETQGHTPIKDAPVTVHSQNGNRYVLMADRTDPDGILDFHLLASQLGKDLVTVTAAGVQRDFILDVMKPSRDEWLSGLKLNGVTSWDLLMSADVRMERDLVEASFPVPVQALNQKMIRLAGFMTPLGIKEKQTHFLLSSVPPSCFFHPPGGPSSAVEVFADKGIEMGYDPMVLEGQFELVQRSEGGILYKLRNAHLVSKGG